MNLTGRPPFQKAAKVKPAPGYLAALHELPCVVCDAYGLQQNSPTTAHHWIMGRGGNRRTPDQEAIPLCDGHHQGTFDTTKIAIHREPERWRQAYGADHDYTAIVQDKIEQEYGITDV